MNDQWHAQGIIIVGPFACESPIALVVTVVSHEDDDGFLFATSLFELFEHAPHDAIESGDHSVIGSDVDLVLFRCIPTPKPSVAIHGLAEEFGLAFKDL